MNRVQVPLGAHDPLLPAAAKVNGVVHNYFLCNQICTWGLCLMKKSPFQNKHPVKHWNLQKLWFA